MKVVYESCTPEEWKRKYDAALKAVGYEVIEETERAESAVGGRPRGTRP